MFYRGPMVPRAGSGFLEKSRGYSSQAIGARSAMRPGHSVEEKAPGKTVGGAVSAGLGGYAAASAMDMANPWLGAGAMIVGYMLS